MMEEAVAAVLIATVRHAVCCFLLSEIRKEDAAVRLFGGCLLQSASLPSVRRSHARSSSPARLPFAGREDGVLLTDLPSHGQRGKGMLPAGRCRSPGCLARCCRR
ncbi:hypothetical protein ACLOJK_040772 [Asimina triloba]